MEEAIYGICFRHQQRAKHEARDYSLKELESLATQVLGAYVLFARWVTRNSQIEDQVRERRDFASNVAVLYWPEILQYQLTELRIPAEDRDLCQELENLRGHAAQLVQQAKELRERGTDPTSEEIREFYVTLEEFASHYEILVSELYLREWGREQAADRWS